MARYIYIIGLQTVSICTLSPFPCCGDGPCIRYIDGLSLGRLDVLTGQVSYILQPSKGWQFYNFAFSSDDQYLAYFRTWIEHPILNMLNLVTGEEQHIPLGGQYSEAGDVIWSPDKSRVVLSARTGSECEEMIYSLLMVNLENLEQTVLAQGPNVSYFPIEWTEDGYILLFNGVNEYYRLDLASLEITPYLSPAP